MTESTPENSSVPPVDRVRQEVDRWLEAVRATGERAMETLGLSGNKPSVPAADVVELSDEVLVLVELPGVSAETVDLSLTGNMLTLVATRSRQDYPADARIHLRERMAGKFQRSIPLPTAVDHDSIHAETRDGLLTVCLRKQVPTPGRSIPVSSGSRGS